MKNCGLCEDNIDIANSINNTKDKYILIILNKYYDIPVLDNLEGEDRNLFYYLLKYYKYPRIVNILDVEYIKNSNYLSFKFDPFIENIFVLYQKDIKTNKPCAEINHKSKYGGINSDRNIIVVTAISIYNQ